MPIMHRQDLTAGGRWRALRLLLDNDSWHAVDKVVQNGLEHQEQTEVTHRVTVSDDTLSQTTTRPAARTRTENHAVTLDERSLERLKTAG